MCVGVCENDKRYMVHTFSLSLLPSCLAIETFKLNEGSLGEQLRGLSMLTVSTLQRNMIRRCTIGIINM